jgi:hypothetical protein
LYCEIQKKKEKKEFNMERKGGKKERATRSEKGRVKEKIREKEKKYKTK